MKLLLFSMFSACLGMHDSVGSATRSGMFKTVKQRGFKSSCLILSVEKDYEDHREEDQPLECELRGNDRNGTSFKMVRIRGIKADWVKKYKIKSGMTELFVENYIIDDENELIIPKTKTLKIGTAKKVARNSLRHLNEVPHDSMNRNLMTGTKTVLVIRADAADSATTATEETLSDDVFGTLGDAVNLKSQYSLCSDGQLQFEPLTTNSLVGTDGVYTVNLPMAFVTGADNEEIRDEMVNQAIADLGAPLETIADYVMLCLPPGTGGWAAYAYLNHWLSVYNDAWCQYASAQLHELGHNLNLGHSNDGATAYGDQSGMMGYSYTEDDGPVMCFNGAKTYQLGWYSQYHVDLPISGSFNWNGNLVGFAEKASASSSDKMIVRIITATTDFYIHFNRKIGMNIGTEEGGDQVMVASRSTGLDFAESNLEVMLGANTYTTISNFNGGSTPLTITVSSIMTTTVPGYATISIQYG